MAPKPQGHILKRFLAYMQHIEIISILKNKCYFQIRQLEKYNQEPCFKELRLSKSKQ